MTKIYSRIELTASISWVCGQLFSSLFFIDFHRTNFSDSAGPFTKPKVFNHTTAIFRQVNKDIAWTHHDALEFPDGKIVLLTHLLEGQEATVLQLPAQPVTSDQTKAQIVF
jgi:hypothetical protein